MVADFHIMCLLYAICCMQYVKQLMYKYQTIDNDKQACILLVELVH